MTPLSLWKGAWEIDGGAFDWLAKLTSNRRAVYVATGAGAQLMALKFRTTRSPDGMRNEDPDALPVARARLSAFGRPTLARTIQPKA